MSLVSEPTNQPPRAGTTGPGADDLAPSPGGVAAAEVSVASKVCSAFERAAEEKYSSVRAEAAAVTLTRTLQAWLDEHSFLAIQVAPDGFRAHRTRLTAGSEVAARLAAAGIRELLFKCGVERREIEHLIALFQDGETPQASPALRLWRIDFDHVVVRTADEMATAGAATAGLRAAAVVPAALTGEHAELVRLFDAGPGQATATQSTDWRHLIAIGADGRSWIHRLQVVTSEEAASRCIRRIAMCAERDPDPVVRASAAKVLGDVVETLVEQRRVPWLRDALVRLRAGGVAGQETPAWIEPSLQRLCTETNALALGAVLDDPNADVEEKTAVRNVLATLPGAVEPLGLLLEKLATMEARRLVCQVLAAVSAGDPRVLITQAAGRPWFVARNVAYVLGRIGDPGVLPLLAPWTRHEDERVRIETARALGRVPAAQSTELLGAMLEDADVRVRQSAVWALATAGDRQALPWLRAILFEDRTFRTRTAEERDDFFRTYGRLADDATFTELLEQLTQRQLLRVGWQSELRRGAAIALGETGRPEAAKVLREYAAGRDRKLREACELALASFEGRRAVPNFTDEDGWCQPARIGKAPREDQGFGLEADDA